MKAALIIMIVLFLILIGFGFYYFFEYIQPMKAKVAELSSENANLKQELNQLAEAKAEKENEVKDVTQTYENLISDMKNEIKQGQVQISELAGKLKVNIVDKILFDSGESTVSTKGKKLLARIGTILKQDTTKSIRVEGHTDNVKIHRRLQKKYPSNWELSASRATNVVRFLQDAAEIDGRRLEAVAYSEFKPLASNSTADGRSQNRRIEILLVPR